MKRFCKLFLPVLLVLTLALPLLTACGESTTPPSKTPIRVISDGESEYVIVYPQGSNEWKKYASQLSSKLRETGTVVEELENAVRVYRTKPLKPTKIKTMPYPGFPTDMQPQMGVLLALAEGDGTITESIYDTRFKYCE
jgi:hypothetical protein